MWKRRSSDDALTRQEWNELASMIMGIDWKLDRILEALEIDDGQEEDRS